MGSLHRSDPMSAPLPGRRLKRRHRTKCSYFEQYNTSIIAAFKSVPSFRAENFKIQRPMMGQCCSCLPTSKKDLFNDRICDAGIRNIFDVRNEPGEGGFSSWCFPYTSYGLRRRSQGKFPDVSLAVLTNKRVVEAVQQTLQEASTEHADSGSKKPPPTLGLYKQSARRILRKMQASISAGLIRLTGWFLLTFLSQFLRTIQVHRGQLKMVEQAAQRGVPVIYVPLHRSHLDYILVTFVLWNYGIRAPYVAAGDNLDIPFFNMLMRGLGGFYIRRKLDKGGKKDHIYRAILHTYMQELLKRGEAFEFFIEGGRTRSGKALTPKGGLLSIVVESCIDGLISDAYIVPISISYERLLDGNFFREQMGLPKVRESFLGAWKGILRVLFQNFGSVRMDFAQPFSVKEYIQCNPAQLNRPLSPMAASSSGESSPESSYPSLSTALTSSSSRASLHFDGMENTRGLVKSMGQHIVHTAVHSAALTCTNMVAFLFLIKFRQGGSPEELVRSFDWLKQELKMRDRDVAFCGESDAVVHYAEALLGPSLVTRRSDGDGVRLIPNLTLPSVFEMTYYGNNCISPFLLEAVIANALMYVGKFSLKSSIPSENGPIRVSREEVVTTAEKLCKLLQEEFIFAPPCMNLTEMLMETVEHFVSMEILGQEETELDSLYTTYDRQWADRLSAQVSWGDEEDEEEDTFREEKPLKVNLDQTEVQDKLQFFQGMLAPILETYLVTAYHISGSLEVQMPEDDFMRNLLSYAQERVTNNSTIYAESASMDTLKNAVKAFQALRIVDCYCSSNLRIIGLAEHYQVREKLRQYIDILERLKE